MDELLKNCNDRLFKVGDKVRIRRDIGCIALLKNADPERYSKLVVTNSKNYSIVPEMVGMAGKTATVSLMSRGGSGKYLFGATYKLNIDYGTYYWRHALLEKVEEEKSDSGGSTKKAQRKKSEERGEDYYGDSKYEEIDISGTKADFFAYDYKGRKRVFPDIDGFITKIDVTIISGDETGLVYFVKDGKANRVAFDASVGTRFISYDDGTYTVEGKDNIKKWLSWSYNKDKANNVNYAIQHMIDFLGGDK